MTVHSPVQGKIAAIVTDRTVAINRGKIHGVTRGMLFAVYIVLDHIQDPDDPVNTLESLRYRKARLRTSQVFDRMSICDIEVTTRSLFPDLFGRLPQVVEDIPPHAPPLIKGEDWVIKPGDHIEEIQEPPPPPPPPAKGG